MSLRTRLTLLFALFAALPMAAAMVPLSRALSEALAQEYAARLEQATQAVEGEVRRLGAEAAAAARELARSPEAGELAREWSDGLLEPADASARGPDWMAARGLDALALVEPRGRVVTSGHLPGRAGDVDPGLRDLLSSGPAGRPATRLLAVATPAGVEDLPFATAWEPLAGRPGLRAVAGVALGSRLAERAAALTGGEVAVRLGSGREVAVAGSRGDAPGRLARLLGAPPPQGRTLRLPAQGEPVAVIELALPSGGLGRALSTAALAFLAALLGGVLAASLVGHLVARRITRPLDALRAGAAAVGQGELSARVEVPASGEVGELVAGFNAMTGELARVTARAAAAERVAAWREVARRLAHEVKNPLTPVAMSVETLREAWTRRSPEFPAIFDEGTRAIGEEVRRLTRIVDEFGRFARLPQPELRPVGGGDLLSAFLALYPEGPPGIELRREVEPALPAVQVDPDQILQVLHNLLRNAFEAVGRRGTVSVRARATPAELWVEVADDGPGIAPADRAHLFEPYFTTKEAGTGLGLAISERIVREHAGRIEVESEPGKGTTFRVRLPRIEQ
ncbi:MAG: HAMP domain-containing protein [Deltaproteobacteria bacterium]|nr:HAMP domain-containing protein [Deltaproteobacteria bacterium]